MLRGGRTVSFAEKARFAARIGQKLKLFGRGGSKSGARYSRSGTNVLEGGGQIFRDFTNCDFKTLCFAG